MNDQEYEREFKERMDDIAAEPLKFRKLSEQEIEQLK